ncbi:hypothetical protein B0A48_14452 [Cryoendolithus antarcticus]|uniref:Zn(2)-C6 fungal-type domain-containing protein n=1 Tax=Cryoendolithus antarcticus TaxID=1507870 RepID=A0A1V8SJY2_9PEZI|nr:hypothetical protein B0A48_14452 [Cryoendolithus antarcticus]
MEPAPTPPPPAPHAKQYVFVDEYNRHKRLKVMRACDGCRKRKIRCDGALQNGPWPCGACTRLKLKCVPPTLDQEEDTNTPAVEYAPSQNRFLFQNTTLNTNLNSSNPSLPAYNTTSPAQTTYSWSTPARTPLSSAPTSAPSMPDGTDVTQYQPAPISAHAQYGHTPDSTYIKDEYFAPTSNPAEAQQFCDVPNLYRAQTEVSESSRSDPEEVDATVKDLTSQMGDLRVDISSMTPWIANHGRNTGDNSGLVDEEDVVLSPSIMADTRVRIPPEMMPSDARIMDYFGYYFDYVHPYIPVLNKDTFYKQWRDARETIPPLMLESIFACVARYLDSAEESKRWLALAAKHEESYKDVPRISTVQSLVILIKARETVTKRGYFYRSWMATKYMVTMAMDLGLHEHHDRHSEGTPCKLRRVDCMVHTRIWQTLFALEVFIGGPQGRSDFLMQHETVDMEPPFPSADLDAFEYQTSRRYAVLSQAIKNTKITNSLYQSLKRQKKDWALDPKFRRHDHNLVDWLQRLPSDLQVHYPADDTPPWLGGDHFVAGMHVYHHLLVIMHHRPQLVTLLEMKDSSWNAHLNTCFEASVSICRLQEALLRDFGLHGILFMLRGINFTVYAILTCAMLHLVAITSPDSGMNSRARKYFTSHMRILERCVSSAGPEVQVQINTLREAFSSDTSRPFELKPGLGMRSPTMEPNRTPPAIDSSRDVLQRTSSQHQSNAAWARLQPTMSATPITPLDPYTSSFQSSAIPPTLPDTTPLANSVHVFEPSLAQTYAVSAYDSHPNSTFQQHPQPYGRDTLPNIEPVSQVWDPSGIFNQWHNAFGPATQPQQPSPPNARYAQAAITTSMLPSLTQASPLSASTSFPQAYTDGSHPTQHMQQQIPEPVAMTAIPAVTPVMWQDAFTSAYASGHGQKRYRDDGLDAGNAYNNFDTKRRG